MVIVENETPSRAELKILNVAICVSIHANAL